MDEKILFERIASSEGDSYFERQIKRLCGRHALNNLFQSHVFDKKLLFEIANAITHRGSVVEDISIDEIEIIDVEQKSCCSSNQQSQPSSTRLGDFSDEVLLTALTSKGFSHRQFVSADVKFFTFENLQKNSYFLFYCDQHWISFRTFDGFNCLYDSLLERPVRIETSEQFFVMLKTVKVIYQIFMFN